MGAASLWGNMVVAVSIASQRIVWRSVARERTAASSSLGFRGACAGPLPSVVESESSNLRAIVAEREMAV